MLVLGLTGGIASGKSTVANMFRALGCTVLDSDGFARDVVMPGTPGWCEIRESFGEEYFLPDGNLNRPLLGATIFGDSAARAKLNQIVHPKVIELIECGIEESRKRGDSVVVVDVPLLLEIGFEGRVDAVVVVNVEPKIQKARLRARDGLTFEEAQSRIDAQLPLSVKVQRADHVIDNSGSLEDTAQQVARLLDKLLGGPLTINSGLQA